MKLTTAQADKIFSAKNYEEAAKIVAQLGLKPTDEDVAELKKYFSMELSDEELDQVAGGYDLCVTEQGGYEWTGEDGNQKYLCPKCGRPVHKTVNNRYYCPFCKLRWLRDIKLKPNLANWSKMR